VSQHPFSCQLLYLRNPSRARLPASCPAASPNFWAFPSDVNSTAMLIAVRKTHARTHNLSSQAQNCGGWNDRNGPAVSGRVALRL
jgi:hypothetical protein